MHDAFFVETEPTHQHHSVVSGGSGVRCFVVRVVCGRGSGIQSVEWHQMFCGQCRVGECVASKSHLSEYFSRGNKFERFRVFWLRLEDSNSIFVVADFFELFEFLVCTCNETGDVHVVWPVCTQVVVSLMIHDDIYIYIYIYVYVQLFLNIDTSVSARSYEVDLREEHSR